MSIFFILYHSKVNIFGFWIVGFKIKTSKDITSDSRKLQFFFTIVGHFRHIMIYHQIIWYWIKPTVNYMRFLIVIFVLMLRWTWLYLCRKLSLAVSICRVPPFHLDLFSTVKPAEETHRFHTADTTQALMSVKSRIKNIRCNYFKTSVRDTQKPSFSTDNSSEPSLKL